MTDMPAARARRELDRMVDSMRHGPSLESGTWVDETLGVYVGWVAHSRSFASRMPLVDETQQRVLVFSGEEYPDPERIRTLLQAGHVFQQKGPAYLVHAYEDDPAFPASLNGIFHGLAVDRQRGNVLLFNDRYGMHRLCFHEAKDGFYFAGEAKASRGSGPTGDYCAAWANSSVAAAFWADL